MEGLNYHDIDRFFMEYMNAVTGGPKDPPGYPFSCILDDIDEENSYEAVQSRELLKRTPDRVLFNEILFDKSNVAIYLNSLGVGKTEGKLIYELDGFDELQIFTPERCLEDILRNERRNQKKERQTTNKKDRSNRWTKNKKNPDEAVGIDSKEVFGHSA